MSYIDKRIQCELPDPPVKEECPICLEKIHKKGIAITECGHKFCLKCILINYYRSNKCPLCRSLVVNNKDKKESPHFLRESPMPNPSRSSYNDPSTIQRRTTRFHQLVENVLTSSMGLEELPTI